MTGAWIRLLRKFGLKTTNIIYIYNIFTHIVFMYGFENNYKFVFVSAGKIIKKKKIHRFTIDSIFVFK